MNKEEIVDLLYKSTWRKNPILTLSEARTYFAKNTSIQCKYSADHHAIIFVTDYLFGYRELENDKMNRRGPVLRFNEFFVSKSCSTNSRVAPRPGLEDGVVDTLDKWMFVFHPNPWTLSMGKPRGIENTVRVIESVEEFADFLIENKLIDY